MGRPRKQQGVPDAKQRIVDAFWELLETHTLREMTVGMLVRRAGCNRGTFYYHYTDIDALVFSAVEAEMLRDKTMAVDLFNIASGTGDPASSSLLQGTRFERLSLIIRQGGSESVGAVIKSIIIDMWQAVLCEDECELKTESRVVIEYASSGLLGVIAYAGQLQEQGQDIVLDIGIISKMAAATLETLSDIEGVSYDEIRTRLTVLNNLHRISAR